MSVDRKGKTFEQIFGVDKAKIIRLKISESHKGRPPWNKGLTVETDVRVARSSRNSPRNRGQHHTEEWKHKMSEIMQRRPITWGDKISKAKEGLPLTEEHKKRLKEAKKLNVHDQLVLKHLAELEEDGYRCIPLLKHSPLPDIIAIKDSKVYAVEIERVRIEPKKYETIHCYDDIIWIFYRRRGRKEK